MFSGGQRRKRIAIARGLMLDPDVVIADEPVSALSTCRCVPGEPDDRLQQDMGLSYVFISHDLSVRWNTLPMKYVVMYLGRCVERNERPDLQQPVIRTPGRCSPPRRGWWTSRERIKLTGEIAEPAEPRRRAAPSTPAAAVFGPLHAVTCSQKLRRPVGLLCRRSG